MTWNRYYRPYTRRIGLPSMGGAQVTRWFILTCIAIFALQLLTDVFIGDDILVRAFALYPDKVLQRPYTLLTSALLHSTSSVYHILFNMLALYFFAPDLERLWGGRRFFFFLVVSAAFSSLVCVFFYTVPVIGASGVVYAVLAAYALMWPKNTIIFFVFPVPALTLVAILLLVQVIQALGASYPQGGGVAHWAHIAGALVGAAAVASDKFRRMLPRRSVSDAERADRIFRKIGLYGIGSLTEEERRFLDEYASRKN